MNIRFGAITPLDVTVTMDEAKEKAQPKPGVLYVLAPSQEIVSNPHYDKTGGDRVHIVRVTGEDIDEIRESVKTLEREADSPPSTAGELAIFNSLRDLRLKNLARCLFLDPETAREGIELVEPLTGMDAFLDGATDRGPC